MIESDLLAAGYEVILAGSVERATASLPHSVSAVVCELTLAGGGAFSIEKVVNDQCPEIPIIIVSEEAADEQTRLLVDETQISSLLTPPHQRTALVSAIEKGRLLRGIRAQRPVVVSFDYWSIADVLRTALVAEWSITIEVPSDAESTILHVRSGHLWDVHQGPSSGETVFREVIGTRNGWFTVIPGEDPEVPRTIHRSLERLLLDGLSSAIVWQRQLADLPGLLLPHRVNLDRATRLTLDGPVARRLSRVLDGRLSLADGLRRARIESLADAQAVRELVEVRVLEPITGYQISKNESNFRPYLDNTDTLPTVKRSGDVVYRKLRAKGRVQEDEWSDLDTADTAARTSKRRWYAAVALVLFSIAGLFVWTIGQDHSSSIEVQVLDEDEE
jgi:hypothetical protein